MYLLRLGEKITFVRHTDSEIRLASLIAKIIMPRPCNTMLSQVGIGNSYVVATSWTAMRLRGKGRLELEKFTSVPRFASQASLQNPTVHQNYD